MPAMVYQSARAPTSRGSRTRVVSSSAPTAAQQVATALRVRIGRRGSRGLSGAGGAPATSAKW
eukprot:scaffold6238_cov104-Isochrysis_galbana.AAC.1